MNAIILSVGDELVSGLTVNTNAAWLSAALAAVGITTRAHVTVGDDLPAIALAITEAAARSPLVLISGGLGPTVDDLTREALAQALGEPLIDDAAARAEIEAFFKARARPMAPTNLLQARRPRSARCLPNDCGTAPGLAATLGRSEIFVMPGVPREMKAMFTAHLLPALRTHAGETITRMTTLHTFGIGESLLGERIADLMTRGANPAVGTAAHEGIVSIRIYATGTSAETESMTQRVRQALHQRLGPVIFGEDDQTLEAAVIAALREKQSTVATAESCTGGLIAELLTNVPGSSACFTRGWITYANAAKTEELGVSDDLLKAHGAVSDPVARAMALGARAAARTDFALAVTGIAGPDGGTPDKPVGTVYLALATPQNVTAWRYAFPGARSQVRLRAAQMALAILRWHLLGLTPEDASR